MIIYQNTKGGFTQDVRNNKIAQKIEDAFYEHCVSHNNSAEYRSWANSMQYMCNVLDDSAISDDCNIAIEYQIPLTGRRIDFLIAGVDDNNQNNVVIVELKQWETSEPTTSSGVVRAYTGGALRSVTHPSYQAYSYARSIECFNEAVEEDHIHFFPCAYLHNYKESSRSNIDSPHYADAVNSAPLFLSEDCTKLRSFIKRYIHQRAGKDLLMCIENGKLRPSKSLQDTLTSMLHGNEEFFLIDEQKVAYELVKKALDKAISGRDFKYTIIIQGGPGTGKSVVAIQLLCDLIKKGHTALYVTKNSAPRDVYFAKLQQDNFRSKYINNLFRGAGSFIDAEPNTFDCILADEAHRLQMKSGLFRNKGESQVKEIINAAKVSVFFIDEQQRVTSADACTVDMIRQYAREMHSNIIEGEEYNLSAQFRCNGSDSYIALINSILGIHSSPNTLLDLDYDIQVFDSPTKMREALRAKNTNNKSRMLAGYCYEWKSKTKAHEVDIRLEDGFEAQWNFNNAGPWAINPNSFDQVGCIHTSQGLEFDYVGVIIGKDLVYKDGQVQTDASERADSDRSLLGIKNKADAADTIIRNTYKTLLTRGQKGCYIYCEDKPLAGYIREQIQNMRQTTVQDVTPLVTEPEKLSPILEDAPEDEKYISMYPVYTIRAACGYFGNLEPVSQLGWMHVSGYGKKDRTKFIVQASGHSMEPRIHDGDYCLFETYKGGSREGKIVLAEHHGEVDSDYEGAYSIKVYHSKKKYDEFGDWEHESITLQPLNRSYDSINIIAEDAESFRIVGEFIETIDLE